METFSPSCCRVFSQKSSIMRKMSSARCARPTRSLPPRAVSDKSAMAFIHHKTPQTKNNNNDNDDNNACVRQADCFEYHPAPNSHAPGCTVQWLVDPRTWEAHSTSLATIESSDESVYQAEDTPKESDPVGSRGPRFPPSETTAFRSQLTTTTTTTTAAHC